MLQFIPLEDDWAAFEKLRPEDLVPYRVGLLDAHAAAGQCGGSHCSSVFSNWPVPCRIDDSCH